MIPSQENLLRTFLDPVNFLESFIKLDTPEGLQKWSMDPYQKHLARDTSHNRAIIKSKKTGISTTIAGESIHSMFVKAGTQVMFVSTGQRIAGELLGKLYDMTESMPSSIQPHFLSHSAEVARFSNGSRVLSLPSSDPGKIRGLGLRGGATDVYLDEYAFTDNDNELWNVVKDFQIIGGRITLNSTPKGNRGKYYQIVSPLQAVYHNLVRKDPKNIWSFHEIPYWVSPRLLAQIDRLKSEMTDIDFRQEYCVEFIDESMSFFP